MMEDEFAEVSVETAILLNDAQPNVERINHLLGLAASLFETVYNFHTLNQRDWEILRAAIWLHDARLDDQDEHVASIKGRLKEFTNSEQHQIELLINYKEREISQDQLIELGVSEDHLDTFFVLMALFRLILSLDGNRSGQTGIDAIGKSHQGLHIEISGPRAPSDLIHSQAQARYLAEALGEPVFLSCDQEPSSDGFSGLSLSKKSIGIAVSDPMAEAGRKVLRFHFAHMMYREPGTRLGEDIEELHKMRVATRRMRAAFGVFGSYFEKEVIKPYRKALRNTASIVGQVRDLDVFLHKFRRDFEQDGKNNPEVLNLITNFLEGKRETARAEMIAYLDSEAYRSFIFEFNSFLNTPYAGVKKSKRGKLSPQKCEISPQP